MKKSLIVIIAAAAFVACNSNQQTATTEETPAEKAVAVKTSKAEIVTIDLKETYTSEILPYKENDITPAAQGLHIDQIRFDVGDHVKEGQVVAMLDRTNLKQMEINLATIQDSYDRMKPVHEAGGISDQQFIELSNTLSLQKEMVEQMRMNSEVKSPISGIVTARNYENGDLFAAMPILHIMQINKLKVKANISEQYYPNVKVGQPVEIHVDIFPGEVFEGKVSRINPALDSATRTFGVEVTIPNANERLRPGMYARATFNMGQREAVMVDDIAVQKQSGSSERFVYVVEDGVAHYRLVDDGRKIDGKVEIRKGVEAGEEIAITSFVRLMNGKAVEVVNE